MPASCASVSPKSYPNDGLHNALAGLAGSVRFEVRILVCLGRQVCAAGAKESSKSGDEAYTVRQGSSIDDHTHNQTMQDEWYRRAELALNKGDDDLAREALKRRKAYAVSALACWPPIHLHAAACMRDRWPNEIRSGRSLTSSCHMPAWGSACDYGPSAAGDPRIPLVQDNAATMKAQVDQQKKATDQLISNTRSAIHLQ